MTELFKFRCYQCQKLIGAPPSRFGSVVKCPKCAAELIVPSPDDDPGPDLEADLETFRPEDLGLRIDPEPITRPVARTVVGPEAVGPDPIAFLQRLDDEPPAENPEVEPGEAEPDPDLPQAEVEPLVARRRGRSAPTAYSASPRARDVVLPRTAAVAWALFALLGLAFAFATGLLVGQRLPR